MNVQEFAKKQGFVKAQKIAPWRGYVCYEALVGDPDEEPRIGFPQIILEKPGVMFRMAQYDEAMAYLDEAGEV